MKILNKIFHSTLLAKFIMNFSPGGNIRGFVFNVYKSNAIKHMVHDTIFYKDILDKNLTLTQVS